VTDGLVLRSGPGLPDGLTIPESDLEERFSRSSGPGGQSVNTTDSRVEVSLDLASCSALSETQRERADRHGVRAPLAAPQPGGGAVTDGRPVARGVGPAAAEEGADQTHEGLAAPKGGEQEAALAGQVTARPGPRPLTDTVCAGR
jgi:hypothetical protein